MHRTDGLKGQRQRPSIGVCAVSGAARGFRHGGQAQGFLKRFQVLRGPQHCLQGVCPIAQWSGASSWHLSCGSSPGRVPCTWKHGHSLPTCTHRCASCMHSTEGLKGQRQRPSIGVCAVSGAARGFRHGGQAQGFLKRFQVLRDPQHCLQGVCQHRSESIAQWSAASSWHLSCGSSPSRVPCTLGSMDIACLRALIIVHPTCIEPTA